MKYRWIIGERHGYWNIKGWGHFVAFLWLKRFRFLRFDWHHFEATVVPLWYRS